MRIRQIKPEDRKRRSAIKDKGRQWNEQWGCPDDDKEKEILDTWDNDKCDDPLNAIQDLSTADLKEIPFDLDDYVNQFHTQRVDKPDVKGKSTNGVCDWLRSLSSHDIPTKSSQIPLTSPNNDDNLLVPEHRKKHVVYRLVYEKNVGDEQNHRREVNEEISKKKLIKKKLNKKPAQVVTESAILIDLEEKNELPIKPTLKIYDDLKSLDMDQWHKFFQGH